MKNGGAGNEKLLVAGGDKRCRKICGKM